MIINDLSYVDDENEVHSMIFIVPMEIDKERMWGSQPLEIDTDDCEAEGQGYGRVDATCPDLDDMEWDGEDDIEGAADGCDLEVER